MERLTPKKRKRIASVEDSQYIKQKKPVTAPQIFKSSESGQKNGSIDTNIALSNNLHALDDQVMEVSTRRSLSPKALKIKGVPLNIGAKQQMMGDFVGLNGGLCSAKVLPDPYLGVDDVVGGVGITSSGTVVLLANGGENGPNQTVQLARQAPSFASGRGTSRPQALKASQAQVTATLTTRHIATVQTHHPRMLPTGSGSRPPASDLLRLEVDSQASQCHLIHIFPSSSIRASEDSQVHTGVQDIHNSPKSAQVLPQQTTSSQQSYLQLHGYPQNTPSPVSRTQPEQQKSQSAANRAPKGFTSPPTMAIQQVIGRHPPENGSNPLGDPRSRSARATPQTQQDCAAQEPARQLTQQCQKGHQSNVQSESSFRVKTYGIQQSLLHHSQHISDSKAHSGQKVHHPRNAPQPNICFRPFSRALFASPSGNVIIELADSSHHQQQWPATELHKDARTFVGWFGKIVRTLTLFPIA